MLMITPATGTDFLRFSTRAPYRPSDYVAHINNLIDGALAKHQSVWLVPGTIED